MSKISQIKVGTTTYDIAGQIPYTTVDSTSTNTAFTAQVSGVTALADGVAVYVRNTKVASTTNCTLNINSLGAKPIYMSNAASTRVTTQWALNTTMLFIYNSTRVTDGCWDLVVGYDTNTNSAVTQNAAITTAGAYPVILGYDTRTTAVTSSVNKTSTLTYDPSTGTLNATKYVGDGSGLTNLPGGTDVNVTQNAAITTAGEYPIILANSTATTAVTGDVNKTSTLKYNPNTQVLTTPKIAATTMTGTLTCQNNTSYSTKQARNIYITPSSTSSVSGAGNGDVWLIY